MLTTKSTTKRGGVKTKMCNKDIKQLLKSKGIYQWQLAEKLGTNEYSFSRKMRKELPKEEKEKIVKVIKEMED